MESTDQSIASAQENEEAAQTVQQSVETAAQPSPVKSRRALVIFVCLFLLIGVGFLVVWLFNEIALQKPLQAVLTSDSRNVGVTVKAHFDGWIDTQSVVFDITDLSEHSSQMDVFRVFLQYAKAQKDQRYKQVILASFGQKKFTLPGEYFQELGAGYDSQNPMYTIRTFAHHVSAMDGAHPFPEYEGGFIGVLGKEMEEFSDFNKQWYLNDLIARHK
jgi:hypothetical protein